MVYKFIETKKKISKIFRETLKKIMSNFYIYNLRSMKKILVNPKKKKKVFTYLNSEFWQMFVKFEEVFVKIYPGIQ